MGPAIKEPINKNAIRRWVEKKRRNERKEGRKKGRREGGRRNADTSFKNKMFDFPLWWFARRSRWTRLSGDQVRGVWGLVPPGGHHSFIQEHGGVCVAVSPLPPAHFLCNQMQLNCGDFLFFFYFKKMWLLLDCGEGFDEAGLSPGEERVLAGLELNIFRFAAAPTSSLAQCRNIKCHLIIDFYLQMKEGLHKCICLLGLKITTTLNTLARRRTASSFRLSFIKSVALS